VAGIINDRDQQLAPFLTVLSGMACQAIRIGTDKGLSLAFGKMITNHRTNSAVKEYGEWELGSFFPVWRIMVAGRIILGSQDISGSLNDMNSQISSLPGNLKNIESLTNFDIKVSFDCGTEIEFIHASSDEDEIFHIFGPDNVYVEYQYPGGWKISRSDK
jgi:hypothetical protein